MLRHSRNWALAVPKIIVLLPSTLLGISLIVLGFSLLFVWTIVDSVLWGIGFVRALRVVLRIS